MKDDKTEVFFENSFCIIDIIESSFGMNLFRLTNSHNQQTTAITRVGIIQNALLSLEQKKILKIAMNINEPIFLIQHRQSI